MLHIIDKYYLSADSVCFYLGTIRKRAGGRISLENVTYHSSIIAALNCAVKRTLRDRIASEEIDSLESTIGEIKHIKAEIDEAIRELDTDLSPQNFIKAKSAHGGEV